ncbi:hypothetical protein RB594_008906 [Gaeumannomyces avenae]
MQFSVAAVAMTLFSLAAAAPAAASADAARIEARANCFGDAVAKGAKCAFSCAGKASSSDCILGCNVTTLGELATCVAGKA